MGKQFTWRYVKEGLVSGQLSPLLGNLEGFVYRDF
jgi:hypothetical protein